MIIICFIIFIILIIHKINPYEPTKIEVMYPICVNWARAEAKRWKWWWLTHKLAVHCRPVDQTYKVGVCPRGFQFSQQFAVHLINQVRERCVVLF